MKKRLTTQEDYKRRIDKIVEFIRMNIDTEIDVQTLADMSAFSAFHFHRIIKAYLGEPIGVFIVRQRLESAAKLLRYSDINISEIAYRVGYDVPSSLTKAFVKLYGISPTKFRQTKNYQIMTNQTIASDVKLSKGKVVELDSKTVMYISKTGNYSNIEYGDIFKMFWEEVKRQGLFSKGIEHLAFYYNSPEVSTGDENLRCDVCLSVHKPVEPNGEIGVKSIAGGKFAVFTYIGQYDKVGQAYDKIYGELLAKNGWVARENFCFEKYISNPTRVDPDKLKTEIYIPVD